MARSRPGYRCTECGASFARWSGRCPNCREWDTLSEVEPEADRRAGAGPHAPAATSLTLAQIAAERQARFSTEIPELDRVLGGGLLPGSAVLLGGEPGVGKSTIVLQALGRMAARGVACLYVSCEESLEQVKLRAERLGVAEAPLSVSSETALENVLALIRSLGPALVAVDSVQRVSAGGMESPAGSLRQVSVCAAALTEACKGAGTALLLVGHVTKQGYLAGPRALEHLVDTVLYFESAPGQSLRILRAAKNRFGAVNEVGVFEMSPHGLSEVANPSELFLAERDPSASGSVVAATLEGSRALLVEVQALVAPGSYGTPERKVSGVDYRRFSMMLSVMERQSGLELGGCDAFVNVAGGVRVMEPAADLPLVLAVASSALNRPLPGDAVAFGEVGLGGEVRTVSRAHERLNEALRIGFQRAIVPLSTAHAAAQLGLDVHPVRNIAEAVAVLGNG